jgi:hypothetical protein
MTQVSSKVLQILDIWHAGLGVISLHVFQNAIACEAYTREACMIDALGMYLIVCFSCEILMSVAVNIVLSVPLYQFFHHCFLRCSNFDKKHGTIVAVRLKQQLFVLWLVFSRLSMALGYT